MHEQLKVNVSLHDLIIMSQNNGVSSTIFLVKDMAGHLQDTRTQAARKERQFQGK